jgi:hypothetical protein
LDLELAKGRLKRNEDATNLELWFIGAFVAISKIINYYNEYQDTRSP